MGKRVKHLTWGEEVRDHMSAIDEHGRPVFVTLACYKTLCKRLDDDSELPPDPMPAERPEGACKPCWRRLLKDLAAELRTEALRVG